VDRYLRVCARHPLAARPELWLGIGGRGPVTPDGIYQIVAQAGRKAGVAVYPHRFRHHFSLPVSTRRSRGRPDGTQRLDLPADAPTLRRQRPQRPSPPHLRPHHERPAMSHHRPKGTEARTATSRPRPQITVHQCRPPEHAPPRLLGRPYGEVPAVRGSFSVRPPPSGRASFPASGSPVTYAVVLTRTPSTASAFCISHTVPSPGVRSPVPLRLAGGFPASLGGALLPRLLWELRRHRTRVP